MISPSAGGKRFLANTPKVVDIALGNWQLNGIITLQRGFPYSLTSPDIGGVLDALAGNRADLVGRPYPSGFHQSIAQWFNTAAFIEAPAGVFGSSGRNILRAPGLENVDLSLFKNFPIKERANLQLRLESFNHTQWGTPVYDASSPRFGQITSANPGRINQLGGKFTWKLTGSSGYLVFLFLCSLLRKLPPICRSTLSKGSERSPSIATPKQNRITKSLGACRPIPLKYTVGSG